MKILRSLPVRIAASLVLASGLFIGTAHAVPDLEFLEAPAPLGEAPQLNLENDPIDLDEPTLVLNGRVWTIRELQYLVATRHLADVSVSPVQINLLRGDDLAYVARLLGAHDYIAQRAREAGLELTDEQEERLSEFVRQFAEGLLYKEEILDYVGEVSEEEIVARYEEERETRYKQREEMRLKHIYTSTYVPHTVDEGETLESIALAIGGSEELAELILSDETKRPRVEGFTNEEGEELAPRALRVGENLLVPTEGEKAEAAREKIGKAAAALAEGTPFREVAEQYSEADNRGRPWVIRPAEQDRPIREELSNAFFALEDGEYSEPIRTPHGFQIIMRVSYTPEGYRELDEALSSSIANTLRSARVNERSDAFIRALIEDGNYIVINEEALDAEEFTDADVLVTVGEKELTRGELNQAAMGRLPSPLTAEILREVLPNLRPVLVEALRLYMKEHGYFERDRVRALEAALRDGLLVEKHLERNAKELARVSEEAVQLYYEENIEQYTQPSGFQLYAARLNRVAEGEEGENATVGALAARLSNVESLEDFKAASDDLAASDGRTQRPGGDLGFVPLTNLNEDQLNIIRRVDIPGASEAVFQRGHAVSWWVEDSTEGGPIPMDEVSDDIREILESGERVKAKEEMIRNAARYSKVEILVD